jgi:hypothetical protein
MHDLQRLTTTVQRNCHISDAHFAGHYTLCVFLLKMREYYRWEKGIPLSHPLPKQAVGEWLTAREQAWDQLESATFEPLRFSGQEFDPFDNQGINRLLNPAGYVYSGGYGLFQKPCFFLGKLDRHETRYGTTLLVSSQEYARDLMAPPAMFLDDTIYIRQESLRRLIWEKIEEWGFKKDTDTPMARALACYAQEDMETTLDHITSHEMESVVLHETGEAMARRQLGPEWEALLDSLPRSRAELLVRAVRDHLADCLSTLPSLVATGNKAALHFYFANFSGMRRELFPQALSAYEDWLESGSLEPLENAYLAGQRYWLQIAQDILALYRNGVEPLDKAIEQRCVPTPASDTHTGEHGERTGI